MNQARKQLEIAGVTLSIHSKDLQWDFEADSRYRSFEVSSEKKDVQVSVHWQPARTEDLGDEVFSARDIPSRYPPNWRLYRSSAGGWSLEVNASAHPDLFRRRMAVFQPDFRRGDVYVDLTRRDLSLYPYPLETPMDRVLFVHVVTHGLGVMLHACGVVQDGKGTIFAGPSNAGKTTLARLWTEYSEATILGDECLILRKRDNRFWVYGTPWVGEAEAFSPLGVPVERIFFIYHAPQNMLATTSPARAVEQLLAQSILTPHDSYAVEYGLDFCLDLVTEIPIQDYGFVPDQSAVELIQGVLAGV